MNKEKGILRNDMPKWCLTIAGKHSAQTFAGPTEEWLQPNADCIVCAVLKKQAKPKRRKRKGSFPYDGELSLFRCAECLAYWHRCCIAMYSVGSGSAEIVAPFLCPVCACGPHMM